MRILALIYGVLSYFLFFGAFLYFIVFLGDLWAPKTVSSAATTDFGTALLIDLSLILLFGIQHSIMARGWFKSAIAAVIPPPIERSTYVLMSTLVLMLLMWFWQPIDGVIWSVTDPSLRIVIWSLFGVGWALVFVSTFLTDHFDLFGLRQVWLNFAQKAYTDVIFMEVLFYKWIRHPMMLGILIALWAVPSMSAGHLVLSLGMTWYVIIGVYFEERGLVATLGNDYVMYQKRTQKLLPKVY